MGHIPNTQKNKITGYAFACECGCGGLLETTTVEKNENNKFMVFEDKDDAFEHASKVSVTKLKMVEITIISEEGDTRDDDIYAKVLRNEEK